MLFLVLLVLFLVPAMAFAGADIKDETLPGSLREYFSADSFNGYTIGKNAWTEGSTYMLYAKAYAYSETERLPWLLAGYTHLK